ncbi:polyphosphate kinase 1 [Archangium minus]|uniref:Polyphosphate kinase n=1 Tax=Archangium minus TaxID=83450 RepID=A0ABY9XBW9_9BACT|nr:polyphosphate kinase 1 [Archangium minus]
MQESPPVEFNDPQLFINREQSWLAFNERVLDDARDRELPLYERLKFFAIASSNLDEFFMVRVAGLKQQLASGVAETAADGMLPAEQLSAISERVHKLVDAASLLWVEELHPRLTAAGISILTRDKLTAEQKAAARTYFTTSVFLALTPLAVDPGHPFPHLRNKSLNVAVLLRREGPKRRRNVRGTSLAVVQVPSVLRRLVPVPTDKGSAFLLLGELIALCAGDLFPGYVVEHAAAFRVTRNWDINVDEEESEDLLSTIQEELRRRDRGAAVRLELDAVASPQIESLLTAALKLGPMDVYRQQAPLQPSDLMTLTELDLRPELRVEPFVPTVPAVLRDTESLLSVVAERDILLHHPYESFDPVVRFLEEAAEDPNVLAIKQTLYRTSGDSPIARALSRAVENGKQVAVLVEIKARLDEANNIAWARKMEESGVHVVYGLIGLKTHSKVALVVRREGNGIRRFVHLGTGNYNPNTARHYTDLSLFTSRTEIADDVSALFNMLTGYAVAPQWKRLAVAPMGLQEKVLSLIQREAEKARRGEPARIVAKMNSLVDSTVIRALYAASQAGVEIDLLVRGICCLRPGVPGVSERIRVTSVVDRFLEHSRVFAFGAGNSPEVWMSSADWMPRNFLRRIEVMFPVEDPAIRQRLLDEVLGVALKDNVKARRLQVDGTYVPVGKDGTQVRSQTVLMELARRNNQQDPKPLEALRHATAPERRDEPLVRPAPQTAN